MVSNKKFVFISSDCFESSALALRLKLIENKDVRVICNSEYDNILSGLIDKERDFVQYMGQGNIFITDDANSGNIADSLRAKGEKVFGGSKVSDKLENNRRYGQEVMKSAGITTARSINFNGHDAFDRAIDFVKDQPKRWVIKQYGNADKSYSSVGKFEDGIDIIDKLNDFKSMWSDDIDFDLQEFVDGHEVGCSAFFNGKDWIRDKNKEIIWEINWEHKKRSTGDLGSTTGETCTLAYRSRRDKKLGKEMLKIENLLKNINYFGNVDINFMVEKKTDKAYGLEFTMRFGYPFLNLQMETLKTPWSEFIPMIVEGKNYIDYRPEWAVVIVVHVPPFPFETQKSSSNAKGQRIYFLNNSKWDGKDNLTTKDMEHIHFYEVKFDEERKIYECSGDSGYLLTVTATGNNPKEANNNALQLIKDKIYTSNMDYREDCGVNIRVEESIKYLYSNGWF